MTKLYMFHPTSNKAVPLDSAMIALRDRLAGEKGYVNRPCTLGSNPVASHHLCWERDDTPAVHQIVRRDLSSRVFLFWPRDVDLAALKVDGGHRQRKVVAAAPAPAWPSWRDVRHEEPAEEGEYLVFVRDPDRPDAATRGLSWWLPYLTTYPGGRSHWSKFGLDHPEWITHWLPLPAPPEN